MKAIRLLLLVLAASPSVYAHKRTGSPEDAERIEKTESPIKKVKRSPAKRLITPMGEHKSLMVATVAGVAILAQQLLKKSLAGETPSATPPSEAQPQDTPQRSEPTPSQPAQAPQPEIFKSETLKKPVRRTVAVAS